MTSTFPSPSTPDVSHIAGPLLFSMLINVGIYGVLCGQTYLYYFTFQNDHRHLKALVYLVFLMETVQTILNIKTVFDAFVYGFLTVASLDHIGNLWLAVPIIGGTVAFISQSLYAYRIITLGQNLGFEGTKYAAGLIAVLAFCQLGGGLAVGLEMLQRKKFSLISDRTVKITVGFWNGGGALCDITIACCMTYILLTSTKRNMMRDTRQRVERVARLTLETGTMTACIAILNIVLTVLPGDPTYYQTTATVLSKLYANCILVVLNSRMQFASGYEGSEELTSQVSTNIDFGTYPDMN